MIFSGFLEERACANCGESRTRVTPTSVMFFVLMAVGGLAVLTESQGVIRDPQWWHWPAAFGGELVLTAVLLGIVIGVRNAFAPMPDTCPSCSEIMISTRRGFFDFAVMPSRAELVLLIIFVGLHVAFLAWLQPGEGMAAGSLWTLVPFFWTPPRNAPLLSPENW